MDFNNMDKCVSLADIGLNYYLNHVWVVNLDNIEQSVVSDVASSLNNQGCVTITVHVGCSFKEIYDKFRCIISQISSCSMILIIITHNDKTSKELLLNVLGYMRCCQMCILYSGGTVSDASLVSTQEISDMVGGLSIKFGEDDMDDISLNSGSMSNSLRFNSISWAVDVNKMNGKQGVVYVGWHLLSYIFGMEIGTKMIVYELLELCDPVTLCRSKIKSRGFGEIKKLQKAKGGYSRPNAKVKLGALFSWALVEYDSIIVIGGFPCKELRRMYKYIDIYTKQVVLIDPAFNANGNCDSVRLIKGEWDFGMSISDNFSKFNIILENDNCLIIDDTWYSKNKWGTLKNKLNGLQPKKNMDVSIKFNWYTDSHDDTIWVDSLYQIMLTPGVNDSNESRVLLKHDIYGSLISKNEYLDMMIAWKSFTMPEQCFMFGFYFSKVIRCVNILDESNLELSKYTILSLYALGNAGRILGHNLRIDTLKEWSNEGVTFMLNIYTNLNNIGDFIYYKGYRDIVYNCGDVFSLYEYGVYSLTVDKLYNILCVLDLERRGFKLMGDLRNIKNVVNESSKRMLLTNYTLPDDARYQSSLFSFASRLKVITIKLRSFREIGMNTTYLLRYNIMADMFGSDNVQYDSKTHALLLDVNKSKNLVLNLFSNRRGIYMRNFIGNYSAAKCNIEVSGHVLNLIMWEVLEPGNLLLWVKQIIFYYNNLRNSAGKNKQLVKERREILLNLWEKGYFIETSLDRLNKHWHTKIEMLLACAIAKEYWNRLINLSDRQLDVIELMSLSIFDIFMRDIQERT